MNHNEVRNRLAAVLLGKPGWQQNPQNDHHFHHQGTGVHVLAYLGEISVTFGRPEAPHEHAMAVRTKYYPTHAIEAVLLTAEALVLARTPSIDAAHLIRQREFSERTFGPGTRTAMVLDHISRELTEIQRRPLDLEEWIDVIILAFDGAWRAGYRPQEIIDAVLDKQTRNEQRRWPDWRTAPADRAIEHDRSGDG